MIFRVGNGGDIFYWGLGPLPPTTTTTTTAATTTTTAAATTTTAAATTTTTAGHKKSLSVLYQYFIYATVTKNIK